MHCPFCGSPTKEVLVYQRQDGLISHRMRCTNRDCYRTTTILEGKRKLKEKHSARL